MAPTLPTEPLCTIGRSGRLLELGRDPLAEAIETLPRSTQTDGLQLRQQELVNRTAQAFLEAGDGRGSSASPAGQVLRMVVGLLGLEVHEKPQSWAEVWLTFQDSCGNALGLDGTADVQGGVPLPSGHTDEVKEWQANVLQHLQELSAKEPPKGSKTIFPDEFQEHLELAEAVLKRITHCVGVLEDPEQQDRPLVLRAYTEEAIMEVSHDVRQWLEQLATLISLYHVCLLDAEGERRRLAELLAKRENKFVKGEEDKNKASSRYDQLQAAWKEEKMRQRAEALIGIKMKGEDALIYSQKDVDEMMKDWEHEHVDPLLEEMSDVKIKRDELLEEVKKIRRDLADARRTNRNTPQPEREPGLSSQQIAQLTGILSQVGDRQSEGALNQFLIKVGEDLQSGAKHLMELLAEVTDMPSCEPVRAVSRGLGDATHPAIQCLQTAREQVESLEVELQQLGATSGPVKALGGFTSWLRSTLTRSEDLWTGAESGGKTAAAPSVDLSSLGGAPAAATVPGKPMSTQTEPQADASLLHVKCQAVENQLRSQIADLKRQIQEKIQECREATSAGVKQAEAALRAMEAELKGAHSEIKELRRRIKDMERLMKAKGLGKELQQAMFEAGLSEVLLDSDVFERLYQDALDRMRRFAEVQLRQLEATSAEYLRAVEAVCTAPPLAEAVAAVEKPQRSGRQVGGSHSPRQRGDFARAEAHRAHGHVTLHKPDLRGPVPFVVGHEIQQPMVVSQFQAPLRNMAPLPLPPEVCRLPPDKPGGALLIGAAQRSWSDPRGADLPPVLRCVGHHVRGHATAAAADGVARQSSVSPPRASQAPRGPGWQTFVSAANTALARGATGPDLEAGHGLHIGSLGSGRPGASAAHINMQDRLRGLRVGGTHTASGGNLPPVQQRLRGIGMHPGGSLSQSTSMPQLGRTGPPRLLMQSVGGLG